MMAVSMTEAMLKWVRGYLNPDELVFDRAISDIRDGLTSFDDNGLLWALHALDYTLRHTGTPIEESALRQAQWDHAQMTWLRREVDTLLTARGFKQE